MAKFKDTSYDARMQIRAQNRMAALKELMTMHMTSANDAFRFVSSLFNIDSCLYALSIAG